MEIFSRLLGLSKAKADRQDSPVCSQQFPQLWTTFVNNFTDVGYTGSSCASPEQAGVSYDVPTRIESAKRIVAIGDLHGDINKAKRAFRTAGLTDDKDRWIGENSVCVQVGDILDRGDHEVRILYFLESLQAQARKAGGALHVLNGNHETMNVMGNHRYASQGSYKEVERFQHWQHLAQRLRKHCNCSSGGPDWQYHSSDSGNGSNGAVPPKSLLAAQAEGMQGSSHFTRTFAMQPGSILAKRFFATHSTILQVGSTVFVHGGVLPHHVEYGLEKINKETVTWLLGSSAPPQHAAQHGQSGNNHNSSSHTMTATNATGTVNNASSTSAATTTPSTGTRTLSTANHASTATTGTGNAYTTTTLSTNSTVTLSSLYGTSSTHASPAVTAPEFLKTAKAVVWARDYSAEDQARCDCDKLTQVLQVIPGASRMVMGHTIQRHGINAACEGKALRVDTGMSRGCGNREVQVLEILQDGQQVRRLREGMAAEDIPHAARQPGTDQVQMLLATQHPTLTVLPQKPVAAC